MGRENDICMKGEEPSKSFRRTALWAAEMNTEKRLNGNRIWVSAGYKF